MNRYHFLPDSPIYKNSFFFDFKAEGFKVLQHIKFTQLKILKFKGKCPKSKDLIEFLEVNGKNLEQLYFDDTKDDDSNLILIKFCPNLKSLRTLFGGDVGKLMTILNDCQQLESLEICKDYECLVIGTKLLEVVVKYVPEKFHELKIRYEHMELDEGDDTEPLLSYNLKYLDLE